jgi:hypothetical protein
MRKTMGGSTVSAVALIEMFSVVDNLDLNPIVDEVEMKLRRVLDSL